LGGPYSDTCVSQNIPCAPVVESCISNLYARPAHSCGSAQDDPFVGDRERSRALLIETTSLRREEELGEWASSCFEVLDGTKDRLWFQDHPRPPSERSIVDGVMHVVRVLAEIDEVDSEQTLASRDADQALFEKTLEHLRKQRQDMDMHERPPGAKGGGSRDFSD